MAEIPPIRPRRRPHKAKRPGERPGRMFIYKAVKYQAASAVLNRKPMAAFARRIIRPMAPTPTNIRSQVEGSGAAETPAVKVAGVLYS